MHLVHGRELGLDVLLGDVGEARVVDVNHELLAPEQRVVFELAGANDDAHLELCLSSQVYVKTSLLRLNEVWNWFIAIGVRIRRSRNLYPRKMNSTTNMRSNTTCH